MMILVKKKKEQQNAVFSQICRQKVQKLLQMLIDLRIYEKETIQTTKRCEIIQTF